ncbi:hypothetical protein MJ559_01050 [Klebsiella pneumoniae]|nr:hypothetical protein MJ559_01050 [Klebsiella pneumoniae]
MTGGIQATGNIPGQSAQCRRTPRRP